MFAKKFVLPVVVASAAGAPYLVMEDGWYDGAVQGMSSIVSSDSEAGTATGAAAGLPFTTGAEYNSEFGYASQSQQIPTGIDPYLAGAPVSDFGELLRFDVTPTWVVGRWPRVSSTSDGRLEGLRVPVVTGTRTDDLAGSLTYFFDPNHRLQRLSFEGYTGDPTRLMALLTQHYGLTPEPTLGAGMFVGRWNGMPTSVAKISRAPVISHASPHAQMHVVMELNRPSQEFGLSPQLHQMLQVDRHSARW
jgi:hypothetical protein